MHALCTQMSSQPHSLVFSLPQVSTLPSGVALASQETNDALSVLSVVVNAGSRHETHSTAGAAAHLKAVAFQVCAPATLFLYRFTSFHITLHFLPHQSSANFSALATVRELEAIGASVSTHSTRDTIAYTVVTPRNNVQAAAAILASAATSVSRRCQPLVSYLLSLSTLFTEPLFHSWEIREQDERLAHAVAHTDASLSE